MRGAHIASDLLKLTSFVKHIDAVDKSEQALDFEKEGMRERKIRNLTPLLGNLSSIYTAKSYDLVVFCLSESLERAWIIAKVRRAKKLVVISKLKHFTNALPDASPSSILFDGADRTLVNVITAGCLECCGKVIEFSPNQPLSSSEDAVLFFTTYEADLHRENEGVPELMRHLQARGSQEWLFYFPMKRELCALC